MIRWFCQQINDYLYESDIEMIHYLRNTRSVTFSNLSFLFKIVLICSPILPRLLLAVTSLPWVRRQFRKFKNNLLVVDIAVVKMIPLVSFLSTTTQAHVKETVPQLVREIIFTGFWITVQLLTVPAPLKLAQSCNVPVLFGAYCQFIYGTLPFLHSNMLCENSKLYK